MFCDRAPQDGQSAKPTPNIKLLAPCQCFQFKPKWIPQWVKPVPEPRSEQDHFRIGLAGTTLSSESQSQTDDASSVIRWFILHCISGCKHLTCFCWIGLKSLREKRECNSSLLIYSLMWVLIWSAGQLVCQVTKQEMNHYTFWAITHFGSDIAVWHMRTHRTELLRICFYPLCEGKYL